MAVKYTESDIRRLVENAKLNMSQDDDSGDKNGNFTTDTTVTPFVGKKGDKLSMAPGFKLKHRDTGLTYTVDEVSVAGQDVMLRASSGDGKIIEIPSNEFKKYSRL